MKISLFLRCTLLTLFVCCLSAIAQDSTQLGLPEGAIARLGKGTLGKIHFSPNDSRLAVSSSIGIWFYDPQTGKALDLLRYTNGVPPFAFAYSPDGNTIASASTNKMTVLTGRIESRLPSISGNIVQMRDVTTGEKEPPSVYRRSMLRMSYSRPMETPSLRQENRTTRYIYGTLRQERLKAPSKG